MMPILACLISGLLTCGVLQLLDHQNTPALTSAGRQKATAAHQSPRPATLAAGLAYGYLAKTTLSVGAGLLPR